MVLFILKDAELGHFKNERSLLKDIPYRRIKS